MPDDTGIDVGRTRFADTILAVTLLFVVLGLGAAARVRPQVPALVFGAALTLLVEAVAYQYPDQVRSAWERQPVRVLSILLAMTTLTVGAVIVPDRSISVAAGALGTYLLLLGAVTAGVVSPPDQ